MRVIFLNRYFYPDHSATSQMAGDLAFHLASRGWEVEVITSRQRYDDAGARLPRREIVGNVTIRRVWTSRFGRSLLLGRAVDYATFYTSSFFALLRAPRHAVVVAMTDPPLVSVVAAAAARRVVNWVQDLFPEVAEELGVVRHGSLLRRARDWSLRRARMNVVLSEGMAAMLNGKRPVPDGGSQSSLALPIAVRHNWAGAALHPVPRETNALRGSWKLGDAFVVGYSGNLGRAHELGTIVEAMRALAGDGRVRFLVIGGGAQLDRVRGETAGLPHVQFQPYQPREVLSESLSAADAHLVSLQPSLEGLIVPSKFYGALAVGRPVIYIGSREGDLARLTIEHDVGIVVAPGDGNGLVRAISELAGDRARAEAMGARGRALYEGRFAAPIAFGEWERILSEAAA
jgi:colanic acid biosynthesis glycosyl transferase WcaI